MAQAVDRAYARVREGIVRGTYAAAVRITEQEIADALSVSRTSVMRSHILAAHAALRGEQDSPALSER